MQRHGIRSERLCDPFEAVFGRLKLLVESLQRVAVETAKLKLLVESLQRVAVETARRPTIHQMHSCSHMDVHYDSSFCSIPGVYSSCALRGEHILTELLLLS